MRAAESVPPSRELSELLIKTVLTPSGTITISSSCPSRPCLIAFVRTVAVTQFRLLQRNLEADPAIDSHYVALQEQLAQYRGLLNADAPEATMLFGAMLRGYDELSRALRTRNAVFRAAATQMEQVLQEQAVRDLKEKERERCCFCSRGSCVMVIAHSPGRTR
jgi:hypothetical protein